MSDDTVEDTVERLAELHRELDAATTPMQRVANAVTAFLGQPGLVAGIFAVVVLWVAGNAVAVRLGYRPIELFPFQDLALTATVSAFLLALIILSTQRHEGDRATKRAQLTLQIALLSEKKVAKVIELLEEQRRENPLLPSRVDDEAQAMSEAADPRATLKKFEVAKGDREFGG